MTVNLRKIGLVVALGMGPLFSQEGSVFSPEQPLPFSHKRHIAASVACADCHVNPEPGEKMAFPTTAKCMACHRTIAADKATIQKLTEYAASGEAIPWIRVYVLPAGTYWSHKSHLEAKLACALCHGDVSSMDRMAKVTDVTSMNGCVNCHRDRKVSTGCEFCHEGR